MKVTPVLLIILDGFGHREECEHNAICQARKPHWNFLWQAHPHTFIDASEKWVGLPKDQMGNSEVGHMNIGAGRVVYQDYTRIENAIETGEFARNPVLLKAVEAARGGRALHVLGIHELNLTFDEFFAKPFDHSPVLTIDTNNLNIVQNPEHLKLIENRIRQSLNLSPFQQMLPLTDSSSR